MAPGTPARPGQGRKRYDKATALHRTILKSVPGSLYNKPMSTILSAPPRTDARLPDAVRRVAESARNATYRLAPYVVATPLKHYEALSAATGVAVHAKLENLQHTGSFKYRGALNRLLTLSDAERQRGVAVASSGNHGAAAARAMRELDVGGVVFVPESASEAKLEKIRREGVDLRFAGRDGLETELYARAWAARHELFYLSPYNDPEVVAGQGSIGVELLQALPDVDALVVAVGGGGLLAGIASVLKAARPGLRVVGVQPAASAVMARSVLAGHVVDAEDGPTLSDGTAGGIEQEALTLPLHQALVDEYVLISEFEIAEALARFRADEGMLVEGAAALVFAAILARAEHLEGMRVAAIVCGGNISPADADLAMAMVGGSVAADLQRLEPP